MSMSTSVCYEKRNGECKDDDRKDDDQFYDNIRFQCVADSTGINIPQGMSNGHCYSKESLKEWLSKEPLNEDLFGGKFSDADKKLIYKPCYQEDTGVATALNGVFDYYDNFSASSDGATDPEGELTWQEIRDLNADIKLSSILSKNTNVGDLFIHRIISWNKIPHGKYLAQKLFKLQLSGQQLSDHNVFDLYIVQELLEANEAELAEQYFGQKEKMIETKEDYKKVFQYFEEQARRHLSTEGFLAMMQEEGPPRSTSDQILAQKTIRRIWDSSVVRLQDQFLRELFVRVGYKTLCDML